MLYKINNPKQVGKRMRDKLSTQGVKPTVRNIADKMDCSTTTITKITKGRQIDWNTVQEVAKFIGANASDIASEVN